MKRTTAQAHLNNRYTEGNPALNVPATVVGAEEMNNIQEEIVNVVLGAGIALDGAVENQLLSAINTLISTGGSAQISHAIVDGQAVASTITGLEFNPASKIGAEIFYHLSRRDDAINAVQSGKLIVYYDEENTAWHITEEIYKPATQSQAVGVIFSINGSGQVQYTSTTFGGTNYLAFFKASVKIINK